MGIEFQTNLNLNADPNQPQHIPHIKWVTDYVAGKVKAPVRVVSVSNLAGTYDPSTKTFTMGAVGQLIIDGVPLDVGDRLLSVGQTNGTENGIFVITVAGDLTTEAAFIRADDFDEDEEIFTGVTIGVNSGTLFGGSNWKLTTAGTIILDSTALEFIQVNVAVGVSKYAETITGDSATDEWEIVHNLNTTDISVSVWNMVTNGPVLTDITINDANTITVSFAKTLTPAQVYRVVVMG